MAITSLFQLQFAHHLKRWIPDFLSFEKTYSMHKMDSRKCSKCVQQLLSSWILHVSFLSLFSLLALMIYFWQRTIKLQSLGFSCKWASNCFSMDSKKLSSILDCFGDKKLSKTPKLNTIWLETIARVLNMPIELKGNNYYSKVFKRVNYKL